MTKHDVVIIGGSLAGAACVRELVRLGIDVLAFERDRFPRAKVCGGFVSPGGVACLEEIGVLEDVRRAGAVEIRSAKVRVGAAEVEIPFERPGLGISRSALDEIVARTPHVRQGCGVRSAERTRQGFAVNGVECTVVVDAAGKLSRFTRRESVGEFGIQYTEPTARGDVLDFWFFEDGYGGAVSIEGGRSNFCFLIKKDRLGRYLSRPDCLVTGPLAYDRVPGDYIAIGDAAGMVDPFCGEGMRHALDSGLIAARIIARGLRSRLTYDEIRREYELEWHRRWSRKRALGEAVRSVMNYKNFFRAGLQLAPSWLVNRLWD